MLVRSLCTIFKQDTLVKIALVEVALVDSADDGYEHCTELIFGGELASHPGNFVLSADLLNDTETGKKYCVHDPSLL